MFGHSIPLFKIFGFSVKMDWSWLIICVLITWSLATGLFPFFFEDLTPTAYWLMGVVGALGLFASIVLHELGHSLAARRFDVEMRGITLFIFGGVAEMQDEPPNAVAEGVIAIAGPIVSVVIGVCCLAAGFAGGAAGLTPAVYGVLYYLGWINLVLVVFNMVPAFPLDGGRVLRAILWSYKGNLKWATRITSAIGSAFGIALIVLGIMRFMMGDFIGGMWWFLLGMFLRGAAQMSYQQVLVRRALQGEPVRRLMQSEVHVVPSGTTVQRFVDDYVYRFHHKMFPVVDDHRLLGCITTRRLHDLPPEQWSHHTVDELVIPCDEHNVIDPETDATDALRRMTQNGNSRLMVVEHGQLRGVVSLKDIMKFISLKAELEDS